MNGRRTKVKYFEIRELSMCESLHGKVIQMRKSSVDKYSMRCFEHIDETVQAASF